MNGHPLLDSEKPCKCGRFPMYFCMIWKDLTWSGCKKFEDEDKEEKEVKE